MAIEFLKPDVKKTIPGTTAVELIAQVTPNFSIGSDTA